MQEKYIALNSQRTNEKKIQKNENYELKNLGTAKFRKHNPTKNNLKIKRFVFASKGNLFDKIFKTQQNIPQLTLYNKLNIVRKQGTKCRCF